MALCNNCRLLFRQTGGALSRARRIQTRHSSTNASSIQDILSKPTWSARSLLTSDTTEATTTTTTDDIITPAQLHHLLRLSALPLPKSEAEEASMIATLQSQLHFVRAVQRVDTAGVEPLSAIRDETEAAAREAAVGLDALGDVLAKELREGHYQRPRRVREKPSSPPEEENWDALATASRKAGRFFVVESGKTQDQDASG